MAKETDLTLHSPRSARVRLGGFVILPRMIDKCRALLVGKNGDYKYACPLDQRFLEFAGVDPEKFKEQVALGKGDGELLEWIKANASHSRNEVEIAVWSKLQESRAPSDSESRAFFNELHKEAGANRDDISSWFDLLDLDDYTSYGGKA